MTASTTSNVRRRLAAGLSTCVLAASISVVSLFLTATPASACNISLRAPYKYTSALVSVRVLNDNCQNNLQSTLSRHRWYGWQVLRFRYVDQDDSATLTWNCSGTGTYTYRAAYGNTWHYHTGPQRRLSC